MTSSQEPAGAGSPLLLFQRVSKRFGGTLFGGVGAVSPTVPDLNVDQLRMSGGAGVRFLLFPGKDIYTRFDVAFTNEGVGYYLFIGEAF